MRSKVTAKDYAWLLAPLVPVVLLFTLYAWLPVLLLVLLVRYLLKPEGRKVTDRNRAKARHNERQQRISTVVQMHLAANGLPNTAGNRAWAIASLGRSRSSGRGR